MPRAGWMRTVTGFGRRRIRSWPSSSWAAIRRSWRPSRHNVGGDRGTRGSAGRNAAGLTADFLVPRTFDAALVHWELSGDPDPYPLWHSDAGEDGAELCGVGEPAGGRGHRAGARAGRPRGAAASSTWSSSAFSRTKCRRCCLYHPVYTYGVRNKVRDVQMGPLNTPGDRYQSIAGWYIVTKRVTERAAPVELDTRNSGDIKRLQLNSRAEVAEWQTR
jgi:hypothetical protein